MDLLSSEVSHFHRAKENSDGLVNLEKEAASAAVLGDLKHAVSLVYGEEYAHQKASILDPVRSAVVAIEDRLTAERGVLSLQGEASQAISILATLLTLGAILRPSGCFFTSVLSFLWAS